MMGSIELVPALIYKLGRPETARVASQALSRFGDQVTDLLAKLSP